MTFDINNYKGKYVMHCKTEEEAIDFCNYLHSVGRRWTFEESYASDTKWQNYKSDTAYNFNQGSFTSISWYKDLNYTILEWSDFMNNKFTKADLKTGDVVLRRDGSTEIVMRELGTLVTKTGWNDLSSIKEDLTSVNGSYADIMVVRRPCEKRDCQFRAFNYGWGELIYKRKEVEEMTLEEVCKALGKEVKIVKEKTNE